MLVNRIKELRTERGWTQEELAQKVGVSRQAVISIEKYRYTPSLEPAFQLAKVFELTVHDIFSQKEETEC